MSSTGYSRVAVAMSCIGRLESVFDRDLKSEETSLANVLALMAATTISAGIVPDAVCTCWNI